MARVTVGIPVYNGEAMISECLDSILSQSFTDFRVIICDNASTDGTEEICRSYASKDRRISLIRNEINIGHEANFRKVLSYCETDLFCWRADDDYTSKHFLRILVSALDDNPDCQLAAPSVVTRMSLTEYTSVVSPEFLSKRSTAREIGDSLFNYHASIFYGVWRTEYLRKIIETIWDQFPYAYSRDHLTVLRPIINRQIICCAEALFTQRIYSPPKGDGMRGRLTITKRIERLSRLMPLFYSTFEAEVAQANLLPAEKTYIKKLRNSYTYQKLRASRARIIRLKLKRLLFLILRKTV